MRNPDSLTFDCDACGHAITVTLRSAGRVEVCPTCAAYVDVPELLPILNAADLPADLSATGDDRLLQYEIVDGFPRPDWEQFRECIPKSATDEVLSTIYWAAAREWLQMIQSHLPPIYSIAESPNFLVLCPTDMHEAPLIARFCEMCRDHVLFLLSDVAGDIGYGPHVVLGFASAEAYNSYIACFLPEGEFGASAGMCLRQDYIHVAMPFSPLGWRSVIAHELTHVLLSHLTLPLWVEEAIAQVTENRTERSSAVDPDHALRREHVLHWQACGLQPFWDGSAFSSAIEDRQRLAYSLAEILMRIIFRDYGQRLPAFVSAADWRDCGEAAAQLHLGCGLRDVAARFLGAGPWQSPALVSDDAVRDPLLRPTELRCL